MSVELPAVRTPWTTASLLHDYAAAWRFFGIEPSRITLAICWGQAAIETGRGGYGCFNGNIGNVMGEAPETGAFHVLKKAPECSVNPYAIPGATVLTSSHVVCAPGMSPYLPAGGSRFRAYPDVATGCRDKIRVVARLWPRAVAILAAATDTIAALEYAMALIRGVGNPLTPDEASFVLAGAYELGAIPTGTRKYMTAAPNDYAKSIQDLAVECLRTTPPGAWPPVMPAMPITVEKLADLSLTSPATLLRAGEGEHTLYPLDNDRPYLEDGFVLPDLTKKNDS